MTDVFISYRTADEPMTAVLIKQALSARFGARRIFLDNMSIDLGADFPPILWAALRECRAVVAIIGSRWFAPGANGSRRVDDPEDFVRRELVEALKLGTRVIPVLVGDVRLSAVDLPAPLAALADRQYLQIRTRAVEHDVNRLVDELARLIGLGAEPAEVADTPGAAVVSNFYGEVKAPKAVFGISNGN